VTSRPFLTAQDGGERAHHPAAASRARCSRRALGAFQPLGDGFVFVTAAGNPIRRTAFGDVWRAAVKAASAPAGTGFHQLRHFYASLLIRHGESVKTVQARLGHASASETLDTYSHLWPDSDDRTRTAVDSVLFADFVRTGEVVDGDNP
jgi:integrase